MLGKYFKKILGKEKEISPKDKFYSPLRIGLHSTISINMVDWLLFKENINQSFVMPSSSLSVLCVGEIVLANGKEKIYNFYIVDDINSEYILQLYVNVKNDQESILESTLYKQVFNIAPLSSTEWDEYMDKIGNNTIELDDNIYNRVWASEHNGKVDLIDFYEKIISDDEPLEYDNHYLLYNRKVTSITGNENEELLLVGVEETDETAEIVMMVGLPISINNIDVL